MRNESVSNNTELRHSLRSALGPGFQFSGPGDALLRAASSRLAGAAHTDPIQRS